MSIDGINVTQLLCELGEASAMNSSVNLFRLCLNAQRVLDHLDIGRASSPDGPMPMVLSCSVGEVA
jgi:hypothetical protein